jgi:hypothetical protein
MIPDLDAKILKKLEEYSGPCVTEFSRDKESAYREVRSEDPRVRYGALALVHMKWGMSQDVVDFCEQAATGDPDAKVRGLAVTSLWSYYATRNEPRIKKILADIVHNECEDSDVREVAYRGLFFLADIEPSKMPPLSVLKFPGDIDWEFVKSFL